ncbi:MAG: single-stranded DNA-binding protein [Anaerolineae bacterium]
MYSKIVLVGNLGSDPEMRYTPNGQAVCSFSVAVNRRWNDAQGNTHDETTWYRVNTWGKLAEQCSQYLTKGRMVLVEGDRIKVNPYMTRDNQPAASLDLTAQVVRFIGGRDSAPGAPGGRPAGAVPTYEGPGQLSEDEIPF